MKMAEERASLAEKENVLMSAIVLREGDCAVTVLPEFGGKISSIRLGGRELLQSPLSPIQARTRTMGFDESDASGWDECLPSVAACHVETAAGSATVPDHGDLWRVKWHEVAGTRERRLVTGQKGSEATTSTTLIADCFSLPLQLERSVQLSHVNGGWKLRLGYKLHNLAKYNVPWSWAAHPLFAVEPGDRILMPDTIRSLKIEGSGGARLGNSGAIVDWPRVTLRDGSKADLSVVAASDRGIGEKLFAGPLLPDEHWCALERASTGVRIRVSFDVKETPYLGLWLCYGGWPARPGPKQVCVAIEPATAPVDSLAVTGPWSRSLGPGESVSWPMEVEIERTGR